MLSQTIYFFLSYLNITNEDGVNFLLKITFLLKLAGGFAASLTLMPGIKMSSIMLLFSVLMIVAGIMVSALIRHKNGIKGFHLFMDEIMIPFIFSYSIYLTLRVLFAFLA